MCKHEVSPGRGDDGGGVYWDGYGIRGSKDYTNVRYREILCYIYISFKKINNLPHCEVTHVGRLEISLCGFGGIKQYFFIMNL